MFLHLYQPIRSREIIDARIRWGETTEGIHLDFKQAANLKEPVELAKDVAAFANTFGGTLLIGVSEKTNERNMKVAQGRVSVDNAEGLRRFFNQDIRSYLHPGISLTTDFIKYDDSTTLCAVNVEPSVDLVWVIVNRDTSAAAFPFRNDYGKNYWRPQEAEMRWNGTERRVFLKFASFFQGNNSLYLTLYPAPLKPHPTAVKEEIYKEYQEQEANPFIPDSKAISPGPFGFSRFVIAQNPKISVHANELKTSAFTLLWENVKPSTGNNFGDVFNNTLSIPYSFVREIWKLSSQYLAVALSAQVYFNGQRLDLVPLEK